MYRVLRRSLVADVWFLGLGFAVKVLKLWFWSEGLRLGKVFGRFLGFREGLQLGKVS